MKWLVALPFFQRLVSFLHFLLCIEASKVKAEVRWEDLYNEGSEYPHIYGELNFDAVVKFVAFEPNVDGGFSLPQELAELQ
ncbi:DUF952 domain-containing protein [Paenibacillus sp. P3E]|uniref:DUF952 domain-containing protein n=1 Tax=Paenibacillus sp. P3E TaxID=1349435 RepID=UPI0021161694|nr:DUF952 domain-containing protein [Paenibacillus sp. P3E]